jgi:hypothetical protein
VADANVTISGGHISDDVFFKNAVWNHRLVANAWMETWTTDSDMGTWTESGTIAKESTIIKNGLYSAKIANGSYIRLGYAGTAGINIRWRILYYNAAGATLRFTVRDTTSTKYLQSDGTWAATPTYFNLPASVGAWSEYVTTAAVGETTGVVYRMDLTSSGGDTYVDGSLVEYSSTWAVHDGDTYKYVSHLVSAITKPVFKGTDSTAAGEYSVITAAASLEAIAAGEYFHDTATGTIYYKLVSGETITDLNIMTPRDGAAITLNADGITANNLNAYFSHGGISVTGGTGSVLNSCGAYNVYATGIPVFGAATVTCNSCTSNGNKSIAAVHGGGYTAVNTSQFTLIGSIAEGNDDDAYQPANTATMILKYCVGNVTGAGSVLEVSTASGGRIEVYNSTFYRNSTVDEAVIRDKGDADTVSIYRNNITVNAGTGQNVTIDTPDRSAGAGSVTAQTNMYYGGGVTAAYTATNADPLFVNAAGGDFRRRCPAHDGTDLCATLVTATDYKGDAVCTTSTYVGTGTVPSAGAYNECVCGGGSFGFVFNWGF